VLEAIAANGARVVDRLVAGRIIVVVIVVIVGFVNPCECNTRNRTVDDRRQFDGRLVFVIVFEAKIVVIVVVIARIAHDGGALVGQLRRVVLGLL